MNQPKFKVGDIVRRKNGVDPQAVKSVVRDSYNLSYYYQCHYVKSYTNHYPKGQLEKDLVLFENSEGTFGDYKNHTVETFKEEKEDEMNTLYEYTDKDGTKKFVHYLATNSNGDWVVEEKGSGNVFSASKTEFTEVVPYTVDIEFKDSTGRSGTEYNYTSSKDKFKVGDMLMMDHTYGYSLAIVKAVDTKSKKATKELKPIGRFTMERFDEE